MAEGDAVSAASIRAEGHSTKPPARYTEATLIKELEEREIGRPSTYASIIGTILNRGYVYKKGTALVPAWLAFSVIRLLEEHFARLVSYEFTAGMEDVLDEIAGGRRDRNTELAEFYFGSGQVEGLKKLVTELGDIDAKELATFPIGGRRQRDRPAGRQVRPLPRGSRRRRHPGGQEGQRARRPAARRAHPGEGQGAARQPGRRGDPARHAPGDRARGGREERPLRPLRHRAAPRGRPQEGQAAHRLAVQGHVAGHDHPRAGGQAALAAARRRRSTASGEEITAQNGRYGPYLKRAPTRARSRPSSSSSTSPSTRRCAIYAQPKQRGRAAAAAPLKELGNDPVSGAPVVVKAGRFGEYVTDGEYNATLRKDDSVEAITLERAAELLAERRAKGPAKKAAKKSGPRSRGPGSTPRRRPRRRPRRPRRSPEAGSVG